MGPSSMSMSMSSQGQNSEAFVGIGTSSTSNSSTRSGRRIIPELSLNSISNMNSIRQPLFGRMDDESNSNKCTRISTPTRTKTTYNYTRHILGLGIGSVSASSSQLFMTGKDSSNDSNNNGGGGGDRDREIYNDDDEDEDHVEYYHDDDGKFYNEEALLELLALDDLDELDADDLDVIGIDDMNELKELERMLNQQQQQQQQGQGQGKASSWTSEEMIEEKKDDIKSQTKNEAAAMFPPPSTTTTTTNNTNTDSIIDPVSQPQTSLRSTSSSPSASASALEQALLQGVVPASAGVGSNCLPGDYGFDPLGFATKDYFKKAQIAILDILPGTGAGTGAGADASQFPKGYDPGAALSKQIQTQLDYDNTMRPPALILRDYREIEIRHGRLAMLAALLWPMQEITDQLFIPESFGSTTMIYGGVTLPYVTLGMTAIMLLLGYLDIYAASIKENDAGDAFLPGECFWDPLSILDGTSETVKRNMQARELNNGRFAMIAVLSYILQESIMHQPLITLPWNQILFEPAFEIPAVQAWLDGQFAGAITGKGVIEQYIVDGEVIKEVKVVIDGIGIGGDNIDIGVSSPNTSIDIVNDAAGIIE